MNVLSKKELSEALETIPNWTQRDNSIERTYELGSFPKAVGFVNGIASYADTKDHHPDIAIHFDKVKLRLTTWSKKAITDKDIEVAKYFDFIYED